ncbi:tRNA (guanosine(37)-N1)-methyltransferase TrmD [Buchnera aphidicola (Thelaxes californica)]|uniref:tRNA (guanine-N(1)-)-methyltransferase n=1 Tax=Buchnera aphidicola (Thelaxes californica) TaxID=1315998 RepID=A0A4D6YLI3_9GAMM|nr:tRNA (guanosine(37)-N1)-methyltransferase TrmD [Buchnera aphidicola]QCI26834.1 tRNA (guanosine(37)-N1)-methyltransferase TrmD [Buchnera aphidicola (Thelaxes californica)]
MHIKIISIFPEMFYPIINYGITKQAINKKKLQIQLIQLRNFSNNKRKNIDDRPYGGGAGMIFTAPPLKRAIHFSKLKSKTPIKVIYLSPQGKKINQKNIDELMKNHTLILICGRYEGIDERIILTEIDEEWSIGDYVLSGGELAAMVLIDVITRFIPGVIKKKQSLIEESFFHGILDCPHYTRPKKISGIHVPKILLSGNHKKICEWKIQTAIKNTLKKRPDLLKNINYKKITKSKL